jgi:nitrous oxidase accessory protein NosD
MRHLLVVLAAMLAQTPPSPSDIRLIRPGARGPQPSITCPANAVNIAPGSSIQAAINANQAGASFCLKVGTHTIAASIIPKARDTFTCEFGAIVSGKGWTSSDENVAGFLGNQDAIDDVTIRNCTIRDMPFGGVRHHQGADRWIVEHNELTANRYGVEAGTGAVIRRNRITRNIGDVLAAYRLRGGGYTAYLTTGATFEDNEIAYNGPEQKVSRSTSTTFKGNWLHHNHENGIWFDADNIDAVIESNTSEDHVSMGIFYEISGRGIIRANVSRRNESGIFLSTSRDVDIVGNVLEDNFRGMNLFVNCGSVGQGTVISADLRGNTIRDNTIRVPKTSGALATIINAAGTCLPAYLDGSKGNRYTGNRYVVPSLSAALWWWGGARTWAAWQGLGHDTAGTLNGK